MATSWRSGSEDESTSAAHPQPEGEVKHSKSKASKIAQDKLAYEDGKYYDMSLWKAVSMTIWRPFALAIVCNAYNRKLCSHGQLLGVDIKRSPGLALLS